MRGQGVDIIIVLSHCGIEIDSEIALHAGPDIDVIIGGHSHTFMYTGDNPPGPDRPRGDYPTIVTHDDGHKVSSLFNATLFNPLSRFLSYRF